MSEGGTDRAEPETLIKNLRGKNERRELKYIKIWEDKESRGEISS